MSESERSKILVLCDRKFWHTYSLMSLPNTVRARISIRVFLRLTAMDVCCGPPSY
jgi:hypothetical protein